MLQTSGSKVSKGYIDFYSQNFTYGSNKVSYKSDDSNVLASMHVYVRVSLCAYYICVCCKIFTCCMLHGCLPRISIFKKQRKLFFSTGTSWHLLIYICMHGNSNTKNMRNLLLSVTRTSFYCCGCWSLHFDAR